MTSRHHQRKWGLTLLHDFMLKIHSTILMKFYYTKILWNVTNSMEPSFTSSHLIVLCKSKKLKMKILNQNNLVFLLMMVKPSLNSIFFVPGENFCLTFASTKNYYNFLRYFSRTTLFSANFWHKSDIWYRHITVADTTNIILIKTFFLF